MWVGIEKQESEKRQTHINWYRRQQNIANGPILVSF